MTIQEIDKSKNKSYNEQQKIVADLAAKAQVPYRLPTLLEAATCILAEYSNSHTRLFSDCPPTFTRCQDSIQDCRVMVGNFSSDGLEICTNIYDFDFIGVAALRKL